MLPLEAAPGALSMILTGSPETSTSRPNASRAKKTPGFKTERGVKLAVEGGFEPLDPDIEIAQQVLGDFAVEGLGRLQRFAAAVTEHETAVDGEFVALGVAAEIVAIVENENARALAARPDDRNGPRRAR